MLTNDVVFVDQFGIDFLSAKVSRDNSSAKNVTPPFKEGTRLNFAEGEIHHTPGMARKIEAAGLSKSITFSRSPN